MESSDNHASGRSPWRLPRRDYVLLPLLIVATILVMFGTAEAVSRITFVQHERDSCMAQDSKLGTRFLPDCTSRVKAAEGPWVVNRYNACGYRTPQSCGPKKPDDVRIAVLGSSIAQGYLVPYPETFAARAGAQLASTCHRNVEFQNLASIGYVWQRLAMRVGSALALQPDAAVIVIVPFDLQQSEIPPANAGGHASSNEEAMKHLDSLADTSRAVLAAQHFLFRRPRLYARLYLGYGDRADFLRVPFSAKWQHRLGDFDELLGGIAGKFHAAGVPLFLAFVPQRAQAVLLAAHAEPAGVDPYALGRAIGAIARRHGVHYIDLSATFSRVAGAASMYYPVDGHLNGQGDAILAREIAAGLRQKVAALRDCGSAPLTIGSIAR